MLPKFGCRDIIQSVFWKCDSLSSLLTPGMKKRGKENSPLLTAEYRIFPKKGKNAMCRISDVASYFNPQMSLKFWTDTQCNEYQLLKVLAALVKNRIRYWADDVLCRNIRCERTSPSPTSSLFWLDYHCYEIIWQRTHTSVFFKPRSE